MDVWPWLRLAAFQEARPGRSRYAVGATTGVAVLLLAAFVIESNTMRRSDVAPIHLELMHAVPFRDANAPIAAAANSTSDMAWVAPDRSTLVLSDVHRRDEDTISFDEPVTVIAPGSGRFWAASGKQLFQVDRRHGGGPSVGRPVLALDQHIGGVAETNTGLWVAVRADAFTLVRRFDKFVAPSRAIRLEETHRIRIAGEGVTLHPQEGEGIILALRGEPYTIMLLSERMELVGRVDPTRVRAFRKQLPEDQAIVSFSAVPLESGKVLQWFVSLNSSWRSAVVWDAERVDLARQSVSTAPMALMQRIGSEGQYLGGRETTGGRELLFYRHVRQ